jgi:hypothetical protein
MENVSLNLDLSWPRTPQSLALRDKIVPLSRHQMLALLQGRSRVPALDHQPQMLSRLPAQDLANLLMLRLLDGTIQAAELDVPKIGTGASAESL